MKASDRMLRDFGLEINQFCKLVDGELVSSISGADKIHPEDEDFINFYTVYTNKTHDEVRNAVSKAFPYVSCGHDHDCCGCYFRRSVISRPMFDRESVAYYIVETLSRNI